MKLDRHRRRHHVAGWTFEAARGPEGYARLWAGDDDSLACGLGAAHAHDRQVQMVMARIVGTGRLAECLADDEATFGIDVFMRQMGFSRSAEREVIELAPEARRFAEAYAAGVNWVMAAESRPIEFRLVGHRPDPWTPADTLLTVKLMSYLGLAQSQQDMEKLVIEAIRGGAAVVHDQAGVRFRSKQ